MHIPEDGRLREHPGGLGGHGTEAGELQVPPVLVGCLRPDLLQNLVDTGILCFADPKGDLAGLEDLQLQLTLDSKARVVSLIELKRRFYR